jgi:porphobilinogen synthase
MSEQLFPPVLKQRMRRRRMHPVLRDLTRETRLHVHDLIMPLFVHHGRGVRQAIASMPGQYQLSVDNLPDELASLQQLGVQSVILFGIPEHKDGQGSAACKDDGVIQLAVQAIKKNAPEMLVIVDLCLCEYTDHGHCGVIDDATGVVNNDLTLELLVEQAISLARSGADVVAPSGMMDGVVAAIRSGLDSHGFKQLPILSYAVKYQSAFYGPFREAAKGAPGVGDRANHQMQIGNVEEGLREAEIDIDEGADMLMVKPAGHYLDVIYRVQQANPGVPVLGYQVSGEYAAMQAAIAQGWLGSEVIMESLLAIKRSGASAIISYFAKDVALVLANNS